MASPPPFPFDEEDEEPRSNTEEPLEEGPSSEADGCFLPVIIPPEEDTADDGFETGDSLEVSQQQQQLPIGGGSLRVGLSQEGLSEASLRVSSAALENNEPGTKSEHFSSSSSSGSFNDIEIVGGEFDDGLNLEQLSVKG